MTNPNTQLLRRDLQLCMASGPDAPPPPHQLPGALPAHAHTHAHAHSCAGSDFKTISILFISDLHPSQPPLVSSVILELYKRASRRLLVTLEEISTFSPVARPPSVSLFHPDYQETAISKRDILIVMSTY